MQISLGVWKGAQVDSCFRGGILRLLHCLALIIAGGQLVGRAGAQPALPAPAYIVSAANSLTSGTATPDQAWANLSTLISKRLDSQRLLLGVDPTTLLSQADQYAEISLAARAFASAYPTDKRAPFAHKTEVLAAFQAVQSGGSDYAAAAAQLATAYLADSTNLAADRTDVRLLQLQTASVASINGRQLLEAPAALLSLADTLYAQFGANPRVFDQYLMLLQTADPATLATLAPRLSALEDAPAQIKSESAKALRRCVLIGKPAPLAMVDINGESVDPVGDGRRTVYVFWDGTTGGNQLKSLSPLYASLPPGLRWIYVAAGGSSAPSSQVQSMAPAPGVHCYELPQFTGPMMQSFAVPQLPYVFVTDTSGNIQGFGSPAVMAALLSRN